MATSPVRIYGGIVVASCSAPSNAGTGIGRLTRATIERHGRCSRATGNRLVVIDGEGGASSPPTTSLPRVMPLQSGDLVIEVYASEGSASHPSDPEGGPARHLVLLHARGLRGAANVAGTEAKMLPSARLLSPNRVTRPLLLGGQERSVATRMCPSAAGCGKPWCPFEQGELLPAGTTGFSPPCSDWWTG